MVETILSAQAPVRRDKRYSANEVPWLRRARFKYGADVQLLDISANGIRVTHYGEIAAGAPVVFEFSTISGTTSVQARVIHCREVEIGGWIAYEIGCRFACTLPWFAQDTNSSAGDIVDLLHLSERERMPLESRHEPLWAERAVAGCCELGAGVGMAVTLLLVLAEYARQFFS